MAFGLKVWDASGDLVVDTTHRLPRLIHTQYISSGTTGSVEIPGVSDKQTFFIAGAVNVNYWVEQDKRIARIKQAGISLVLTTLSWVPGNVDTIVFVFIYD